MSVLERLVELVREAARRVIGPRLVPAPAAVPVRVSGLVRPARLVDR
jgi:hypothetical protein